MPSAAHQDLEKGASLINTHKLTGQECIADHHKLKGSFPKAVTSPPLPQEPATTQETSLISTAIRTRLLLHAALVTSQDIRRGETAMRPASLAGGEGGQIGSMDPGVVRTEELRERFLDNAPNARLP